MRLRIGRRRLLTWLLWLAPLALLLWLLGAVVLRPERWMHSTLGAALPAVGVMDMLRFHKWTIGWAWVSDYGSSDDPEQFETLYAYSPYHNLRSGIHYPAVMVTTAPGTKLADEPHPNQCSACFILSVNDTMPSIQRWIATESEIFRGGSGSGVNLSRIRADGEALSNGGAASGPVSFMRWADSGAGSIKSGGVVHTQEEIVRQLRRELDCPPERAHRFIRAAGLQQKAP